MRYRELENTDPGAQLVVEKISFSVSEVSEYETKTGDEWINLGSKKSLGGEDVLELSDGTVRRWNQVFDLMNASVILEAVFYHDRRFEAVELRTQAKVKTRTIYDLEKEIEEQSITSVYEDKDGVLLSIELKGPNLYVWYSDSTVSPRDIILAQ
ncbi:hypothetical protein ES703_41982 [subsurface metagenome]